MKRLFILFIVLGLLGAIIFFMRSLPEKKEEKPQQSGGRDNRVLVSVAHAYYEDVPVTYDTIGTMQAFNSVAIKPQIEGKLLELPFREGQEIKEGDILAQLDSSVQQAQYDQAIAKKMSTQVALENERRSLERYQRLESVRSASPQEVDKYRTSVASYEAQLQQDEAHVEHMRAALNHMTLRSPIDGRVGIRTVDVGNLVSPNNQNPIVTVTQLHPIYAMFNLPQQQLRPVLEAIEKHKLGVLALDGDTDEILDKGEVKVVDNQIDSTTGTVRVKAQFPNAKGLLWPGQFVNIRLFIQTLEGAIVVPPAGIQRGPDGPFVYTISPDYTSQMQPVKILKEDGERVVIASGLVPPQTIITSSFVQLQEGTEVKIHIPSGPNSAIKAAPRSDVEDSEPSSSEDSSPGSFQPSEVLPLPEKYPPAESSESDASEGRS